MNKKEQIVQILKCVLKRTHGKFDFPHDLLEEAIMETRGHDPRTVKGWMDFLWKMNFYTRTKPGQYILNMDRMVELECPELITHQTTILEHTHTQSSKQQY